MIPTVKKIDPGAIRGLSAVSLHKVVQLAGLVATVALVPGVILAVDCLSQ